MHREWDIEQWGWLRLVMSDHLQSSQQKEEKEYGGRSVNDTGL